MSRWDATLPYLSPGLGRGCSPSTPSRSAFRERVVGSPRSVSPASSSSSGQGSPRSQDGGGGLPHDEDIYDLPSAELKALEVRLGECVRSGNAAPREERLHKLVKVELSERRSVEEIGLALVGGRFNLEQVPGLGSLDAETHTPSESFAALETSPQLSARASRSPSSASSPTGAGRRLLAQRPSLSLGAASPSSSSRGARTPSPAHRLNMEHYGSLGKSPGSMLHNSSSGYSLGNAGASIGGAPPHAASALLSTGGSSGSTGLSKNFKPTPVAFDFVIGKSSVKKGKPKPKKKKPPPEEPPVKAAEKGRQQQARPPLAPGSRTADSKGAARKTAAETAKANRAAAAEAARARGRAPEGPQRSGSLSRKADNHSVRGAARSGADEPGKRSSDSEGAGQAPGAAVSNPAASGSSTRSPSEASSQATGGFEPAVGEDAPAVGEDALPVGEDALPVGEDALPVAEDAPCSAQVAGTPTAESAQMPAGASFGQAVDKEIQNSTGRNGQDSPKVGNGNTFSPEPRIIPSTRCMQATDESSGLERSLMEDATDEISELERRAAPVALGFEEEDRVDQYADMRDSLLAASAQGTPTSAAGSQMGSAEKETPEQNLTSEVSLEASLGQCEAEVQDAVRSLAAMNDARSPGWEREELQTQPSATCASLGPDVEEQDVDREPEAASRAVSPARIAGSVQDTESDWRPQSGASDISAVYEDTPMPSARRNIYVEEEGKMASKALPVATEAAPKRAAIPPSLAAEVAKNCSAAGKADARAGPAAQRGRDGGSERQPRRPPLPHDALRGTRDNSRARASAAELDLVGLDPKLVEKGQIRSYSEQFQNLSALFTWGHGTSSDPGAKKEQYLRETLQLFGQFCGIIGSLETQFKQDLAPTDNATPSATQQALSAMDARGAGLYGVFLKGVIDKMGDTAPAQPVPRPLAPRDVFCSCYYKVVQNRTEVYDIVTRVFHKKEGWEELPHGLGLSNVWNLCWTWSKPKLDYSRLCVWQKVNHFPENKHLTRKDCLKRCIDRYTRLGGRVAQLFDICPKTFVLPKEYCRFIEAFAKIAEDNGDFEDAAKATELAERPQGAGQEGMVDKTKIESTAKKQKVPNLWIMKPAGSSRGRGIQVVNDVGSVHYGELTIIQQYVSNPYLIGGYKWDMRTYVTVTSFNPLEAFIYRDGFARFTTVPYSNDADNIDNKFVHLTNSSIQRHNEDSMMQNADGNTTGVAAERQRDALLGGTKISFMTLKDRLRFLGINWEVVWAKMIEVILKSLCMAEDHIPYQVNSFELFGYDLLLDKDMKIWLIEVNASPSMGQEHLLDEQVKQPLISDTIDLVNPMEFDRKRLVDVLHRRVEKKGATGLVGGRQQLDIDLHAILRGQVPRKYGEMPKIMGNYERIAPGEICDNVMRLRGQLFNKQTST